MDLSKNGTKVNGSRVQKHVLTPGDCIRIGNAVLEVRGADMAGSSGDVSSSSGNPAGTPAASGGGADSRHHNPPKRSRHERLRKRARTERQVERMIHLLTSFSVSLPSNSGNCRIQDHFYGETDKRFLPIKQRGRADSQRQLRSTLVDCIRRVSRSRLDFYRRTARYLRRSEQSRRRLRKSWEEKFVKK